MSSSITLSCSLQSEQDHGCSIGHPNRDWSPGEIVRHVVAIHHVNLRDSLREVQNLRPRLAEFALVQGSRWGNILRQLVKLHDALLSSLDWEESEVFPRLLRWQKEGRPQSAPDELLAAFKIVERSHAWCLQTLWRLLRLTRDERPIAANAEDHHRFLDHLIALQSEYEQHLFEVECLLLPITGAGVNYSQLPATTHARR